MYTDTRHGKASHIRECSQIYPGIGEEGISPERLDEIRPKLDQRIAGMGQIAHRPGENRNTLNISPISEMQALITCKRTVFDRLVCDQMDGWMVSR